MDENPRRSFPTLVAAPALNDGDEETDLLEYWTILVERRRVLFAILLLTLVLGTAITLLTAPEYLATASLKIERQGPEILTYQDVLGVDPMGYKNFYQTQYEIIQSRAVLRRGAERLDLVNRPEFLARQESSLRKAVRWGKSLFKGRGESGDSMNRAIEFIEEGLTVGPIRNSHLVRISFLDRDPELSRDVVEAVAGAYQQFSLEERYTTTEQANEFLMKEVARTQAEITQLEGRLQQYGTEREILTIGDGTQDISEQALMDLNARLTGARGRSAVAQAHYEAVMNSPPESLPGVLESPLIGTLREEYAELERRYILQADRFKPGWPALAGLRQQLDQSRERLEVEIQNIASQVREAARASHGQAVAEVANLEQQVNRQKRAVQRFNHDAIEYASLKAEIETRRGVLAELVARQSQTETSGQLRDTRASNIRVVDHAEVPERPARPRVFLNLILSICIGAFLGIAVALLLHHVDNTIKTEQDIERYAPGVPVLGYLPLHAPRAGKDQKGPAEPNELAHDVDLACHIAQHSPFAEAFKNLRTSLLLASADHPPRRILVTSCEPGDGKSVVALNLSIVLTQMGKRVLLIDADLRRPRLHRSLARGNKVGLSSFLTGNAELADLFNETEVPGLTVITSGPIPPNPSELLGSPMLASLLTHFETAAPYDHVVVDSPPTVHVADSLLLSTKVDATILVARSRVTPRESMIKGISRLRQGKAKLAGTVLNAVCDRFGQYYRYAYYGPREGQADDGPDPEPPPPRLSVASTRTASRPHTG